MTTTMRDNETPPATGIAAVVFDWAGTVVDFGSHAPMGAFVELFAGQGVEISIAEARAPMGMPKWDHIQALGRTPRIAEAWTTVHGKSFDHADVDRLYELFTPMNAAAIPKHSALVSGAADTVAALRERGIKIGSTTGYNREIMGVLAPLAAEQGFAPDNLICAGDVEQNRPAPLGMYRTFIDLGVWPAERVVKVDDTVPGLLEGRNAGCWTVAVLASGNELGLTVDEWESARDALRDGWRAEARAGLVAGLADFTIDTVADLLPIVDVIGTRLASGERPRIS